MLFISKSSGKDVLYLKKKIIFILIESCLQQEKYLKQLLD